MTIDFAQARRAVKTGLTGHALGEKFGVSTREANGLLAVGRRLRQVEESVLTAAEILVMQTIAAVVREQLKAGETRASESKVVSWRAGKKAGWCAATVRKRLFVSRYNAIKGKDELGLGFVELAGNGFVWLTPTGWALVHAMEAARDNG